MTWSSRTTRDDHELDADGFLHFRLVPLLGIAIGELFDLERLAADCDADGTMFVAVPFNKVGGVRPWPAQAP